MSVSLAALVEQIMAPPYKKPKRVKGDGICPRCKTEPKSIYADGKPRAYCKKCSSLIVKEHREKNAVKRIPTDY